MPEYDSNRFDPPAPVARVTLRGVKSRKSVHEVLMLIDSGSDVTLVPDNYLSDLATSLEETKPVELARYDGHVSITQSVELDLTFLGVTLRGFFPVVQSPVGILGGNALNRFAILHDGPGLAWEELTDSAK